jgi:hypothetical protein
LPVLLTAFLSTTCIASGALSDRDMAQARAHADDLGLHLLGGESDLGGGRVYRFRTRTHESAEPLLTQLATLVWAVTRSDTEFGPIPASE